MKIDNVAYVTKLAGFEHTEYIQNNCTHIKLNDTDVPLFIGKTVRNGRIDPKFDWYISKELSDKLPRSKLNKKCIVLPYVGSIGDLAVFEHEYDAHLGSNVAKIELNDNSGYLEEFIYYFLKTPYGQKLLFRDVQGAVQKNITMEAIRNVELPEVAIEWQKKIVYVLKSLDDKIETNNKISKELESLTKTIYDYWFVQFDFPDENGKPYKTSGGKMVYNEELKREIPEGWKVEKIKDILIENEKSSIQVGEAEKLKGDIPFYTSGEEILSCKENLIDGRNCYMSTGGNFTIKYYVGKASYSTDTWCISAKDNLEDYLYMTIKSYGEAFHRKYFAGTGLKHLQKDLFRNTYIVIPNSELIESFNKLSNNIFEKISVNYIENQKLSELRDFLLPLLMNGQVGFKK